MEPQDLNIPDLFPHRHPFLLVDKIESLTDGRAVAIKAVTRSEPWFTGHFPDRPVFPGVLMLEAMAQTGRFLDSLDRELLSARLARIDSVKFFREVVPGEVIRMEARRIGALGALSKFHVDATVDGHAAASADFYVHSVLGDVENDVTAVDSVEVLA
jgi:3-hydroxyacyl-[acyl-carrier-protein] dehydratase